MAAQLVPLPEVERLSPACVRILGGNPGKFTLQGTNTYLVGTGRERLLIDTGEGMASWAAALERVLAREGGDGAKVALAAALITHWHPDHVGGIAEVRRLVPGVPVYQSRLAAVGHSDPQHGALLDIVDGQVFRVEGATLRAVHTPGHTTDHMAFVLEEEGAVFAGDNVLGQGTAVFEDLAVYLQSLARMRALYDSDAAGSGTSGRLYPGHGPVVDDGATKITQYIAHRQQREDEVMGLLRSRDVKPASAASAPSATPDADTSAWTVMDLVQVIYADVNPALYPACERGLLQILHKLLGEGKVAQGVETWRLRERSPL